MRKKVTGLGSPLRLGNLGHENDKRKVMENTLNDVQTQETSPHYVLKNSHVPIGLVP